MIWGAVGLILLVTWVSSLNDKPSNSSSLPVKVNTNQQQTTGDQKVADERPTSTPSDVPASSTDQVSPSTSSQLANTQLIPTDQKKNLAKVTRVIDGDTLDVEIAGQRERIRLIGMDTPESVDTRKTVECFALEASNKLSKLVGGKEITVTPDPLQGDRDKYNRLLRYAFLPDGTHVNRQMISEGYAHEYTYDVPYQYQTEFKRAEQEAQNAKRGLWADDACGGDTTSPDQQNAPKSPSESSTMGQETPQGAPLTTACDCSSNRYNCSDFKTHAEAQAVYNCCKQKVGIDVHRLDGTDNDGLACETLP